MIETRFRAFAILRLLQIRRVTSRKKHLFIHAHRFLLVSFVVLIMKPLVVVQFYVIKPFYDIPEQLLNFITHFMIFSKL
jgi:hypothetical protein